MEASEISKIIEQEINGNWSVSNAHGVDLKRCWVKPTKQIYENSLVLGLFSVVDIPNMIYATSKENETLAFLIAELSLPRHR